MAIIDIPKTENKWLQYKTAFLIGEIHRKNKNHQKAIFELFKY